jgi:hypothetical protein
MELFHGTQCCVMLPPIGKSPIKRTVVDVTVGSLIKHHHWFDNIIYSDNDYILFLSFLIVSLIFNNIPVWIYHLNVTLSFLLEFVLSWSFDMLVHVDFILTFIGFPISKLWAYLIKTILETRRVPQIRYLRFYDYHWVNASDGGLLANKNDRVTFKWSIHTGICY